LGCPCSLHIALAEDALLVGKREENLIRLELTGVRAALMAVPERTRIKI
jgi:hypothetical protein